jgi:hypothetical protein
MGPHTWERKEMLCVGLKYHKHFPLAVFYVKTWEKNYDYHFAIEKWVKQL